MDTNALEDILSYFTINGSPVKIAPFGSGHINDTFRVTTEDATGTQYNYTLQRINHFVFRKPQWVMDNIERTLSHIASKAKDFPGVRTLNLVRTKEQRNCVRTFDGKWWRMYDFIDDVESYDNVRDPDIVYQAARGFAQFQNMVADLPLPRLHETIPYFHHTPMRYATLEEVAYLDLRNRASEVREELEFVHKRRHLVAHLLGRYLRGQIPERITHNDTKLNNALFNPTTKQCVAVVDLDTVMPGLALYDFGDLCRTTCNTADESEPNTDLVQFDIHMFEAAVAGYLDTATFLVPTEVQELAFSAWLLPFMVGIRFLTDYLQGDTYFKIHYTQQNLDRCRSQFKLVERMENLREEMQAIVQRCTTATGRY
ncbi:MAG: aminoglycoside phosphotransferase family protein [Kiritimatiellia bacterium]